MRAANWREHPWTGVFPATLCPFHADESIDEESNASAVRRSVSLGAMVSADVDNVTQPPTLTAVLSDTPPALAVMVAVPLAAAVTNPVESTAATRVSLLAHMTGSLSITITRRVGRAPPPRDARCRPMLRALQHSG